MYTLRNEKWVNDKSDFKVPWNTSSKMHVFPLNVPYSEYSDPCPSHCIKTSWATRTNKRVNHSFVTLAAYGKFLFLSIIGAKHARICPIFFSFIEMAPWSWCMGHEIGRSNKFMKSVPWIEVNENWTWMPCQLWTKSYYLAFCVGPLPSNRKVTSPPLIFPVPSCK